MQEQILVEELESQVPVCGANFRTPVTDVADYIDEIHYEIGGIRYIENAEDLSDGPVVSL